MYPEMSDEVANYSRKKSMIVKDETVLRQKSEPVVDYAEGFEIVNKLIAELGPNAHMNALGLAAPQIGIQKRVFIAWGSTGKSKEEGWNFYVNPILEEVSTENRLFFKEGCLSFPGATVRTHRNDEIVVSTLEEDGERHRYVLLGQDAIVFAHELDHLNGILFFDRVANSVPQEDNVGKDKIGRNDVCPCGSKLKYKKCCGK